MNFHDEIANNDRFYFKDLQQRNLIKSDLNDYDLVSKFIFGSELKEGNPLNYSDVHFEGKISNFYFHINPTFINSRNKGYIGSKYSRSNISARFEHAYLKYEHDNFYLKIGRSPVNWGEAHSYSIIQSGLSPGYDHIGFNINLVNINYDLIIGQLSSVEDERYGRIKRFVSAKKITFTPNDKLSFGFGDQIIYTGHNRSIELHYLNPFIPYFLSGLEYEEDETVFDNDNSMLFLFGKFSYKKYLSFFGEALIDDFQIDETNRPNKIGLKIGMNGYVTIMKNKLSFYIDRSFIQASTYIHNGLYTNWDNLNYNLGSVFGAGSKNYFGQFVYHFSKNIKLLLELNHLEKENFNNTNLGNDNYEKNFIFYDFSIIKKYSNNYLKIGRKNFDIPYGIKKNFYHLGPDKFYFSYMYNFKLNY